MAERENTNEQRFFEGAAPEATGLAEVLGTTDPMGLENRRSERLHARRRRAQVVFGFFGLAVAVLGWLVADDLVYFFRARAPIDLGSAEDLRLDALGHNRFVRVSGIARDMCIRAEVFSERMRYLYFLGSDAGGRVLIQAGERDEGGCTGAVEGTFEGRLLDLARTDRYGAVAAYYREHFPAAPRGGALYLLERDVRPGDVWLFPVLMAGLLSLAALNLLLLRRRAQNSGPMIPDEGDTT